MDRLEVSDELWERIRPLLPEWERRQRWPGRLPLDDRACLNGIPTVLSTAPFATCEDAGAGNAVAAVAVLAIDRVAWCVS